MTTPQAYAASKPCQYCKKHEAEIERLKRIIAKELTENDGLECEYTYVNILIEENMRMRMTLDYIAQNIKEYG